MLVAAAAAAQPLKKDVRPRARDLGLKPGVFEPGPWNAITDVHGVLVGQLTMIDGANIRTGVTVVVPLIPATSSSTKSRARCTSATHLANWRARRAGEDELGDIETPIVLTNTLSVGAAMESCRRVGRARAARRTSASTASTPWSARPTTAT